MRKGSNAMYIALLMVGLGAVCHLIYMSFNRDPGRLKVSIESYHYEYDPITGICFAVKGVGSFETRATVPCDKIKQYIPNE